MEGGRSVDRVAELEAENRVLWAKAKAAQALEEKNIHLQSELLSIKNRMVVEMQDAEDQIRAEKEASDALQEKLRELVTESKDHSSLKSENDELRTQMEELQLQIILSKRALESEIHAKAALEEIVDSLQSTNQTYLCDIEVLSIQLRGKSLLDEPRDNPTDDANGARKRGVAKNMMDAIGQLNAWRFERAEVEEEVESLQANLGLGDAASSKLEVSIGNLQAEVDAVKRAAQEMKERHQIELQCLRQDLRSKEAKATSEVPSLRDIQTSSEGSPLGSSLHDQELVERPKEAIKENRYVTDALKTCSILKHEAVQQRTHASLKELELEMESVSTDVCAWKLRACELEDAADERYRFQKENKQITEQLSLKEAMWESEFRKFSELSDETSRMHKEVSAVEFKVNPLEVNLSNGKDEHATLADAMPSERQQHSNAARSWEDDLEPLSGLTITRGSQPTPFARLVEHCEQLAGAHVRDSEAFTREELSSTARDRIHKVATGSAHEIKGLEYERSSIPRQLNQLEGEMKKQERVAVHDNFFTFQTISAKKPKQDIEIMGMRQAVFEVPVAHNSSKPTVSGLTYELEEKSQELALDQDNAHNMLAKKDNEIAKPEAWGKMQSQTHKQQAGCDQEPSAFHNAAVDASSTISFPEDGTSRDQMEVQEALGYPEAHRKSAGASISCTQELQVVKDKGQGQDSLNGCVISIPLPPRIFSRRWWATIVGTLTIHVGTT